MPVPAQPHHLLNRATGPHPPADVCHLHVQPHAQMQHTNVIVGAYLCSELHPLQVSCTPIVHGLLHLVCHRVKSGLAASSMTPPSSASHIHSHL
ncbi:hypothetical protein B0H10DRAFT_2221346 [Mycena sp. CBHHK59/15]|nr:hypothetical protein B0H10DRAFT_2221346 [Mycena sp. CBHHK59/15]